VSKRYAGAALPTACEIRARARVVPRRRTSARRRQPPRFSSCAVMSSFSFPIALFVFLAYVDEVRQNGPALGDAAGKNARKSL